MNIRRMAGDRLLRASEPSYRDIQERVLAPYENNGGQFGARLFAEVAPVDPEAIKQLEDLSIALLQKQGKPITSDNVLSAARELEADYFGYGDTKYSVVTADTSGPIDRLSADEIEF